MNTNSPHRPALSWKDGRTLLQPIVEKYRDFSFFITTFISIQSQKRSEVTSRQRLMSHPFIPLFSSWILNFAQCVCVSTGACVSWTIAFIISAFLWACWSKLYMAAAKSSRWVCWKSTREKWAFCFCVLTSRLSRTRLRLCSTCWPHSHRVGIDFGSAAGPIAV